MKFAWVNAEFLSKKAFTASRLLGYAKILMFLISICMRAISNLLSVFLLSGCYSFGTYTNAVTPEELVIANNYVGMNEQEHRVTLRDFMGIDPVQVEWCAAFVNSVLWEVGIENTDSLLARSYLSWGRSTDTPSPGDVMVFSRGSQGWQGHVGFYVATVTYQKQDYWVVLGGNQDNSVSYKLYTVDHWRHLDTRTVRDEPLSARVLANHKWLVGGIPLEIARSN